MQFEPLTAPLVAAIECWFDDANTIRYLGGRDWVHRALDLMRDTPGVDFKGNTVLARHVWIAFDEANQPVGLIDVEPYSDGTAGFAFVVAPPRRGQGIGKRILLALSQQEELKGVHTLIGAVEPENIASRFCLINANFTVAHVPDGEGMLVVEKKLLR